jgi:hypothetical protein
MVQRRTSGRRRLSVMSDIEIEGRLREAGREFIESHSATETVIREAASAGMLPQVISDISELSPDTVRAFLRAAETS